MATQALSIPAAKGIGVRSVHLRHELHSRNRPLGNHEALMRFRDEEDYILLRDVLEPGSVERARQAMFAVMERHGLDEPGANERVWNGKAFAGPMEESAEFAGIARGGRERPTRGGGQGRRRRGYASARQRQVSGR